MGILQKESLKKSIGRITLLALLVLTACNEAKKPMDSRQPVLKSHKIELTVPATQNVIINEQELEILEQGLPNNFKAEVNVWDETLSGETSDGASVQITFVKEDDTVTALIDVTEDPNNLEQTPFATQAAILTAADQLRNEEEIFVNGPTHPVASNPKIINRLRNYGQMLFEGDNAFYTAQRAD